MVINIAAVKLSKAQIYLIGHEKNGTIMFFQLKNVTLKYINFNFSSCIRQVYILIKNKIKGQFLAKS